MRGNRLVLPKNTQERAIKIAHEGHQGVSKTKSLLRTKVWFIGMDKMVEKIMENCFVKT